MGAKACTCNDREEEQLKFSRENEGFSNVGQYAFPGPGDSAEGVGIPAATVPAASSNHVPPLVLPPPDTEEQGGHADAAAGRLPCVTEETGEDIERALDSENGRIREIAELKEALLVAVDATGQLPAVPGDVSRLEALAARQADAAAGRENSSGDKNVDPQRRDVNVVGGDGVILEMTLPAAADLAFEPEVRTNGPTQEDKVVEATGSRDSAAQNIQLGCFQLINTSSCGCPLDNPSSLYSLEIQRDGIQKHESGGELSCAKDVYIPPGATALVPPNESAGQELQSTKADDIQALMSSQADPQGEAIPSLTENIVARAELQTSQTLAELQARERAAKESLRVLDGDLRRAANELDAPAVQSTEMGHISSMDPEPGSTKSTCDFKLNENQPACEDGLAGEWINAGQVCIVTAEKITFASGESVELETTSATTCHMVLEDTVYYGRLSPCCQKLFWSDGDIWERKAKGKDCAEPTSSLKTEAQQLPSGQQKAAAADNTKAKADLEAQKPKDVEKDAQMSGADTPPRRRCCGGGGGKKNKNLKSSGQR